MQLYMSQVRQPRPIFGPTYNWNIFPAKSSNNYNPKNYDSLFFGLHLDLRTKISYLLFLTIFVAFQRNYCVAVGHVCSCGGMGLCVGLRVVVCGCVGICDCVWVYVLLCVATLKVVCAATTQHSRQTRTQGMFVLQ